LYKIILGEGKFTFFETFYQTSGGHMLICTIVGASAGTSANSEHEALWEEATSTRRYSTTGFLVHMNSSYAPWQADTRR
jgi:hypothetical protein